MENVVFVAVPDMDRATELRNDVERLHSEHGFRLESAAIVMRAADGRVTLYDEVADPDAGVTAAGTAVGAVVGLLTGPLGLLVGGATGAVVGSLFDIAESEDSHAVLGAMSRAVAPGTAALVAIVHEPTPALLDRAAASHGGVVLRSPRGEVELRMAEAEVALLAAQRDADASPRLGHRPGETKGG